MSFSKYLILLLISIVLNRSSEAQNPQSVDRFSLIEKSGVLKVCSQAGFIPFEMKDNKGNWQGFDVDIMKLFAKENNLKLKLIDVSLDGLIPALLTAKCDLIASALTVTEDRKKVVLFSKPVYTVVITAALLNTPENRMKYKKFSDLDSKDTSIASHTGSTGTLFLRKRMQEANLLQFDSENDELNAVLQKRADAFVDDNILISQMSKEKNITLHTLASDEKGELAFAAHKNSPQLIEKINTFLSKIEKNGELEKIRKLYF